MRSTKAWFTTLPPPRTPFLLLLGCEAFLQKEAVAAQSAILHELKEMPAVPKLQEQQSTAEKKTHARPLGVVIKVRPQAKKAKIGQHANSGGSMGVLTTQDATAIIDIKRSSGSDILNESDVLLRTQDAAAAAADIERPSGSHIMNVSNVATGGGLVSYSDESDDD